MKIKILLLPSNPREKDNLRLDEEFRIIKDCILRSKYRNSFEIMQGNAVREQDLRQLVLNFIPHIIHFSGHGSSEGIFIENKKGETHELTGDLLNDFFSMFVSINCLILNSCNSSKLANNINESIPNIIGMPPSVNDDLSIAFSSGFYTALGANFSIKDSFLSGKSSMDIKKHSNSSPEEISLIDKMESPSLIQRNIHTSALPNIDNTFTSWLEFQLKKIQNLATVLNKTYESPNKRLFLKGSAIFVIGYFAYTQGKKFLPLKLRGFELVTNKKNGKIHHALLCKNHLPIEKNLDYINSNLTYESLHRSNSMLILKEIYNDLNIEDKEVFLTEAIHKNPTSTHLYKDLIKLWGKQKKYDKIHSLLERNIEYLSKRSNETINKTIKKQSEKAIKDLKTRQTKAKYLAEYSKSKLT